VSSHNAPIEKTPRNLKEYPDGAEKDKPLLFQSGYIESGECVGFGFCLRSGYAATGPSPIKLRRGRTVLTL
jgi:hypothetical protein